MNTNEGGSKTVALMAQKPLDFIHMLFGLGVYVGLMGVLLAVKVMI